MDTSKDGWFVITGRIVTNPYSNEFENVYHADTWVFETREDAINHGFTLGESDDFNVGQIVAGKLTWFGWMNKAMPQDIPIVARALCIDHEDNDGR